MVIIVFILIGLTSMVAAWYLAPLKGRPARTWMVLAFFFGWIAIAILATLPGTEAKRATAGQEATIALGACLAAILVTLYYLGAFDTRLVQNGLSLNVYNCSWLQLAGSDRQWFCTGPLSTSKPTAEQQQLIDTLSDR